MKLTELIKKHAVFGIVFTIAKATVYFVPLVLADVLSSTDFGVLEYALAGLGMIVNTIINLGVPGAYPYFILRKKKVELTSTFKLHAIVLLIPFLINQLLFFSFNLEINFYFAFNISYIIANQVFYSTQLKSHEKSSIAVLIDSGIYIVLLIYFIALKLNLITSSIKTISVFVFFYSLIYVFTGLFKFFKAKNEVRISQYKEILKFSVHILIGTFLIFLITTSGRILVEIFFDFETVGIYAFYFRLAAVVVMIYQVISISFFKNIYTLDPLILDTYYYLFFIAIFVLSIGIFFIAPFIVGNFSNFFNETFLRNKEVYFLLSAQMVMWIATALNSNVIDRENLAAKNNVRFLVLIIVSLIIIYSIKDTTSLALLVYCHYFVIYIACLIQYYSLSKIKITFTKSSITLTITFLLTSCFYFLFF